jgi:hypothetical protein
MIGHPEPICCPILDNVKNKSRWVVPGISMGLQSSTLRVSPPKAIGLDQASGCRAANLTGPSISGTLSNIELNPIPNMGSIVVVNRVELRLVVARDGREPLRFKRRVCVCELSDQGGVQ